MFYESELDVPKGSQEYPEPQNGSSGTGSRGACGNRLLPKQRAHSKAKSNRDVRKKFKGGTRALEGPYFNAITEDGFCFLVPRIVCFLSEV